MTIGDGERNQFPPRHDTYLQLLKGRQVLLTKRAVRTGLMIAHEGRTDLQAELDRVIEELTLIIVRIERIEALLKPE